MHLALNFTSAAQRYIRPDCGISVSAYDASAFLIEKALATDTTPFVESIGGQIRDAFDTYKAELLHSFAIAAFFKIPLFATEAAAALESDPRFN